MAAEYRLLDAHTVQRVLDGASIPLSPGTLDYAAYQAWLALGHVPDPAPPAPTDRETTNDELLADWTTAQTALANALTGYTTQKDTFTTAVGNMPAGATKNAVQALGLAMQNVVDALTQLNTNKVNALAQAARLVARRRINL